MKMYLRRDEEYPFLDGEVRDSEYPQMWRASALFKVPEGERELPWWDIPDAIAERWLAALAEWRTAQEAMVTAMDSAQRGGWDYGVTPLGAEEVP